MRLTKNCKEKIIASLFIALILFTMGYFISLFIIPLLHPEIENHSLRIHIDEDSDFDNYDFVGSGTQNDPYLIENFTYQEHGLYQIYISGVSKHFMIRNNIIAARAFEYGIRVSTIPDNVSIISNIILGSIQYYNFAEGISVYNVDNCKIINNSIYSNIQGISMYSCSDCSIKNNFMKNGLNIEIKESSNICIENNSLAFEKSKNAWSLESSIFIENSENISIIQNKLYESWIYFSDDSIITATLLDNLINGKEIGFFKNETNFLINSTEDYSQIILVNCSKGLIQEINVSAIDNGISIYSSHLINCNSCIFNLNTYAGLYLYKTENLTIADCLFRYNHIGTRVKYSDFIHFSNNSFHENDYGIYISNSNCSYIDNTFIDNEYDDIRIYDYS